MIQLFALCRGRARLPKIAAGLLMVALVAACAGTVPPPRLYVLSPASPPASGPRAATGQISIVVEAAQVPDYLDRPQIIERTSADELKLLDSDQWAERLSMNIARVLAQNLSAMVPADANIASPARSSLPSDYQVVLSLNSFELAEGRTAIMGGRWSVTNADGTKELAAASVALSEPASGPGIAAVVDAMNHNLAAVSRDIAAAIKKLGPPPKG